MRSPCLIERGGSYSWSYGTILENECRTGNMTNSSSQPDKPFWTLSSEEALKQIGTNPNGLTPDEAQQRLSRFGPNLLKPKSKTDTLTLLINQFRSHLLAHRCLWVETGESRTAPETRPGSLGHYNGGMVLPDTFMFRPGESVDATSSRGQNARDSDYLTGTIYGGMPSLSFSCHDCLCPRRVVSLSKNKDNSQSITILIRLGFPVIKNK